MEKDNWRELFDDDTNFNQEVPYSIESINSKLDKVTDLDHFNPFYLLSPIYDFTKVFGKISSGLGMGFKDITEKVNLMRQIFKCYPQIDNIQDLIKEEMKLNIHELTGDNNKSLGHKNDQYKKYISGSRTFLRLLWFMEFLICIFNKLITEEDKTLKEILKEAYGQVLGPRHTFLVRTAVGAALIIAGCSKEEALMYFFNEKEFNDISKNKIKSIAEKLQTIWKAGNDFYAKNNLLELK